MASITLSDPSPTKAGSVQLTLTGSKVVTKIPSPLVFTDNSGTATKIDLQGQVPGNTFTGVLEVDNSVADGPGQFFLSTDALIDENGNKGNEIIWGTNLIWIDKVPPSKPQYLIGTSQGL